MKKLILMSLCVLFVASVANADTTTFGPIPDFKGVMDVSVTRTIDTWIGINAPIPFDGRLKIGRPDRITVQITVPVPIFAATYIKVETSAAIPFNRETDEIVLTDIWAVDLDPGLDPCEVPYLTGFNPDFPEMRPISDEEFIGLSGTAYPAPVEIHSLGELWGLLPEYDLEKFIQGNPQSIVYVAQAIVPAVDFIDEPEPQDFDFSFDYLGCEHIGGEYPYLHSWTLNIRQWNPAVPMVTDVEVEGPSIIPGYVKVVPPENWSVIPITVGRYGYEANPTDPIVNEGRYTDFRVEAKTPYVEPGQVHLTENGQPVSPIVETRVVAAGPEPELPPPTLLVTLDTFDEWLKALEDGMIKPVDPCQWEDHMIQWNEFDDDDKEPYPHTVFREPQLYVYEGDPAPEEPNDAGLVMYWGNGEDGDSASAWQLKPAGDPDLTNCIITVSVTAPQFALGPSGGQVNQVSLALQNNPMVGGPMRAWYWKCGPAGSGAPIIWNTPTTITIDTSKTGVTAATPTATNYTNNPAFNLKTVMYVVLDENGNWVGGPNPIPGPGGPAMFLWNYWHWLTITPKTTVYKGYYTKWSQPPVALDPHADPPIIIGWDEYSNYEYPPFVADDWECKDNRPITDIHWWGSFIGWTQPHPPPIMPRAFHLGIWTDVPKDPANPDSFSHPGVLIWQNYCDNYVWNFAGYDRDPHNYPPGVEPPNEVGADEPMDACFQFNQLLSQDEWFYQEPGNEPDQPRIYWLSIAPIFNPWDYNNADFYRWGWKTRRPEWNDDAVRIMAVSDASGLVHWPPMIGSVWNSGTPIKWPEDFDEQYSWDVAFELTTNEPGPPDADLNNDGTVNFKDLAILADQWLTAVPIP